VDIAAIPYRLLDLSTHRSFNRASLEEQAGRYAPVLSLMTNASKPGQATLGLIACNDIMKALAVIPSE